MNAISKRLLSWLCVIAMVFSFVPVMDLSGFAVTTKAAEEQTEQTEVDGSEKLPDGVDDIIENAATITAAANALEIGDDGMAICPVCGGDPVKWTESGKPGDKNNVADTKYHYYVRGDDPETTDVNEATAITTAYNWAVLAKSSGMTMCLALIDNPDISIGGVIGIRNSATNSTLNIMGQGTIRSDGSRLTDTQQGVITVQNSGNTVNLYGGTFIYTGNGENYKKVDGVYTPTGKPGAGAINLKGENNTINVFDGAIIGPDSVNTAAEIYNVRLDVNSGKTSTFNMYGGIIRNGVTGMTDGSESILEVAGGNVTIGSANKYAATPVFNMYGGTITGGTVLDGVDYNAGGNIVATVAGSSVNIYGGTIENGYATEGGNIYVSNGAALNIQGGKILNGVAGVEGSVLTSGEASAEYDAEYTADPAAGESQSVTITGTGVNGNGGNIYITDATAQIEGGLIDGGKAYGQKQLTCKVATDKEGKVGAKAYTGSMAGGKGGNICVRRENVDQSDPKLVINGATVSNGIAQSNGGNVYVGAAELTVGTDAKILDGESKVYLQSGQGGGNVYVERLQWYINKAYQTFISTMETSGTIMGGKCTGTQCAGGNINVGTGCDLTVKDGVIANGSITGKKEDGTHAGDSWGGNIRGWNADMTIEGGLIYGGVRELKATEANNIGCQGTQAITLIISGGTIVGDINISNGYTAVVLKNAPTIVTSYDVPGVGTVKAAVGGLQVKSNQVNLADISELSADAKITVTAALNTVFTAASENAANVVGCFKTSNSKHGVSVNDSKQLVVSEKAPQVGEFAPWDFDGKAYCQACIDLGVDKEDALVEWEAYNADNNHGDDVLSVSNKTAHFHFYLDGDYTYTTKYLITTYENICFNLNGYDVIPNTTNATPTISCTQRFNLFNTGEEATVWGNAEAGNGSGCVANVNGGSASGTFNLFKNVILKSEATRDNSPILGIGANGGTINIYGGTIEASDLVVENYPSAIMINGADDESRTTDGKAVVNMYGGTINGGSTVTTQVQKTADGGNGGAIRVGSLSGEGRLYKDPDGDGTKSYYYNTYAGVATFNMYGGTINGGHAEGNNGGGTVYVNGNTFNMYGGTINGGIAKAHDYPGNASEVGKGTNGGYGGAFFLMARTPKDVENNNMDVVPGVVNIEGGTINGYQEDDTTTSFGSVFVVNNDCVLNMSGGTVNGGYATGQGGILRAYLSDVNLSGDAKLYSGWAERNKTHGLWMVDSDLVMSGNAAVYAKNAGDLVVQVGGYKVGSTAIISGNATVKNASGTSSNHVGVPYSADYVNKLMIANDWNGEIYCNINNTSKGSYTPGANITEDNANHYVGALADGVVTKGGTYTGKLYYGSEAIGVLAEDGDLILAAAATVDANGVETWVGSNEAALDAYTAGNAKYVILNGAAEINGNVKIDLNGSNVELTGTGTVYGMDSSNDDYEGYKKLTVADGIIVAADVVNPVNGNRYISLKEGEGEWSFHRVELVLTHVTLRTTEAGLYYKAKYLCDDKLAGQVLGYGVVLSTANMPGNDFMTETKDINDWTMIDGPLAVNDEHVATATSGGLFGVLKDIETTTRTAGENVTAAQMNVYANLYLAIDRIGDGNPNNAEYIMGDTENQDDPAGTAWNLLGVLEAINKTENWSQYSETQKTNVKNAVLTWANWITEAAQIEWAGKLNNILQ